MFACAPYPSFLAAMLALRPHVLATDNHRCCQLESMLLRMDVNITVRECRVVLDEMKSGYRIRREAISLQGNIRCWHKAQMSLSRPGTRSSG